MTIKSFLKAAVQKFGFDVVRYVPEFNRPFDVLPLLIREQLAANDPFFFVQVGAHDGVLDDPLRKLILEHGLAGLMIEPLPDIFDRLCANYATSPNLVFENVAVDVAEGSATIYRVTKHAAFSAYWQGMSSFEKENLRKQGVPKKYIESIEVPAFTLQSLLLKHKIAAVSLLQVDTEGYDYAIVKAALDAGILPKIINYEHCHLVPNVRLACKCLLDSRGYRFIEVGKDTLAVRQT
jgi:FkbM family methyltransferase